MLQYLEKLLIDSGEIKDAETIELICNTLKIRKQVTYNGSLDQFQIPIFVLKDNNITFKNNQSVTFLKVAPIYYYIDEDDNFCFGIKK